MHCTHHPLSSRQFLQPITKHLIQATSLDFPLARTTWQCATNVKVGEEALSTSIPVMPINDSYILLQLIIHSPLGSCRLYEVHNKNIQVTCFYYPPAQMTWYICQGKKDGDNFMSMSIPVMLDEVLLYPIATRHALSSCRLCKVHNTNIQVTCFNYPPTRTTRYVTRRKTGTISCPWADRLCPMKYCSILLRLIVHSPLAGYIKPTTKTFT